MCKLPLIIYTWLALVMSLAIAIVSGLKTAWAIAIVACLRTDSIARVSTFLHGLNVMRTLS